MVTVQLLPNNRRNIMVMYKNGRKGYKLEIKKLKSIGVYARSHYCLRDKVVLKYQNTQLCRSLTRSSFVFSRLTLPKSEAVLGVFCPACPPRSRELSSLLLNQNLQGWDLDFFQALVIPQKRQGQAPLPWSPQGGGSLPWDHHTITDVSKCPVFVLGASVASTKKSTSHIYLFVPMPRNFFAMAFIQVLHERC